MTPVTQRYLQRMFSPRPMPEIERLEWENEELRKEVERLKARLLIWEDAG